MATWLIHYSRLDTEFSQYLIFKMRPFAFLKGYIMTGQEILDLLRNEKPFLRREFGVLSIGLFGSYVKDTQGPESDVDLLIELTEPRFDFLAGLQIYLENKIGKPVELIRKRPGLNERFLQRITSQIHYA
jgi:predicted nucleotidyltransferase